ncbi:RagB/SusD family nutrient uptake outer membrane protein [Rhodohalobacter sp. SW132]|uniref:RagB/SusD family nutrient uptake outer membrane protein n=1 Tax=Rhodohalobacter sp. SW132 TaxID=2293433 RepID=UPI000E242554|nr:RagB/SusD family nutrient uptake outer membrane protein [Rhodohalobacter sp. SW132]REL24579.1 RagB/SusD family nutrient uptake outer membrane protein [Rhodohalobacter sp. SW132]
MISKKCKEDFQSPLRNWMTGAATLLLSAIIFTGCDLGVENPGQIDDTDLDTPGAVTPLVNGVKGDFGYAATIPGGGGLYTSTAVLTDELVHVGTWQPIRLASDGITINSEPENQSRWGYAARARWVAEDAIRRIGNIVDDPQNNADVGMVTLYAGFSNRLKGDTFCDAVVDGGPMQEHTAFSQRAVDFFTDAIAIANNVGDGEMLTAAYGGRAQAHVMLGNWGEALNDADMVPTDFSFDQVHSDNASREHNGVHNWATRGDNGQQMSVWGTPFAEWGTEVNGEYASEEDPRVTFEIQFTSEGDVATGGDNVRPLWYSGKFDSRNSPIPIVKGTEMRLIEAEAALVQNQDVDEAVSKINEVRALHGLDPHDASDYNLDGAWELLMKEKGIELWLEGRRIADLRRWTNTPGSVPFEVIRGDDDNPVNVLNVERMCLEVSSNEINSNPNIN